MKKYYIIMPSIFLLLLLFYHFDDCGAKIHTNLLFSKTLLELPAEGNYIKVNALSGRTTPKPIYQQLGKQGSSSRQQANQYDPYMIAQIIANFDAIRSGNIKINLPKKATIDDIAKAAGAPDYNRLQGWKDTRLYERIPTVIPSIHTLPSRPGGPLPILIQRAPMSRPTLPGPTVATSAAPNIPVQPSVNHPPSPSQQAGTSGFATTVGQGQQLQHTPPNAQQIAQIIANFDALIISINRLPKNSPKDERNKDGIARAAGAPNFETLNGWKNSGLYKNIPTASMSIKTLPKTPGGPVPYLVNGKLYHPPSRSPSPRVSKLSSPSRGRPRSPRRNG